MILGRMNVINYSNVDIFLLWYSILGKLQFKLFEGFNIILNFPITINYLVNFCILSILLPSAILNASVAFGARVGFLVTAFTVVPGSCRLFLAFWCFTRASSLNMWDHKPHATLWGGEREERITAWFPWPREYLTLSHWVLLPFYVRDWFFKMMIILMSFQTWCHCQVSMLKFSALGSTGQFAQWSFLSEIVIDLKLLEKVCQASNNA